jgi:predicted N-acyltransferase
VANELSRRTQQQQDSSWHLLFSDSDTTATLQASLIELLPRIACQFHWFNRGYDSMAHYFSHFNSRKRKAVRKEREKIQQQGIQLRRKLGTELTSADIAFFYQCYQSTYAKRGQRGYLTQAFFIQLAQTMGEQIMLVQAYKAHTPIAASWCFFDHHSLYGRYWGCLEEIDSLHFEACYYQGIEFCLEKGLQHFDPGTQGEHKIARGFEPVFSNSLHYIDHPGFRQAIGHFCQQEAQAVKLYHQQTQQLLPFKID